MTLIIFFLSFTIFCSKRDEKLFTRIFFIELIIFTYIRNNFVFVTENPQVVNRFRNLKMHLIIYIEIFFNGIVVKRGYFWIYQQIHVYLLFFLKQNFPIIALHYVLIFTKHRISETGQLR